MVCLLIQFSGNWVSNLMWRTDGAGEVAQPWNDLVGSGAGACLIPLPTKIPRWMDGWSPMGHFRLGPLLWRDQA